MSETLKPCPFCGGSPVFYRSTGRAHETGNIYSIYSVDCNDCDLTGPRSETRKGAAIAWNRRASGWISVKDQLPEGGERVLVAVFYANSINIHDDFAIKDENGDFEWETYALKSVTHWQPLPSAPEVEE